MSMDMSTHSQQLHYRDVAHQVVENGVQANAEDKPKDVRDEYMRERFDKRDGLLNSLSEGDQTTIKQEMDYLKYVQTNLKLNTERNKIVESLHNCRDDWRKKVHDNMKSIKESVQNSEIYNKKDGDKQRDEDLKRLDRIYRTTPSPPHDDTTQPAPTAPDEYFGINSYAMYFKKSRHHTAGERKGDLQDADVWVGCDSGATQFSGEFPNQKIPVEELLSKSTSPLKRTSGTECIRYFHIPANNMSWVERAMARYYEEDDIVHNDQTSYSGMSAAQRVLCREFWRGQMHGSSEKAPVHGRHMRSRCSLIPCNPASLRNQSTSKKDQGLMKGRTLALFVPYLHWENNSGRARMSAIAQTAPGPRTQNEEPVTSIRKNKTNNFAQLAETAQRLLRPSQSPKAQLAEYFRLLAKLASDIPSDPHAKLFRASLHKDPPMHPRRTLDQYYFSTLKNTTSRDRDQVVYRGTKKEKSDFKNEPRIVMVDQLWLWILDDNTIITSFPRRWGQNKEDVSGVHKSLRTRFENDKEIKSVYHLALIIIDQCSKVFFDRTKPIDERPEVIDIFGSAIGNVADLTSDASGSFWHHTAIYSRRGLSPKDQNASHSYLRINPEGTILRESQDIAEELTIMLRVFHQQLVVVQELKRHVAPVIDPLNQNPKRSVSPEMADQLFDFTQDADVLIELIKNRKAELQDLEDSVQRTCRQIMDLLTLKQQQASILEAKASQRSARASVNQGQTILVLTLVTIFFLPLGFFAAFFGMNNKRSTGDDWMTLSDQIKYMFSISLSVVVLILSAVLGRWYQHRGWLRKKIIRLVRRQKEELPRSNQDDATANKSSRASTPTLHG